MHKTSGAKQAPNFRCENKDFQKNFTKNRYLLVLGAKTSGTKHPILGAKEVAHRSDWTHYMCFFKALFAISKGVLQSTPRARSTSKYSSTEHVHQKVRSLENRDYVLTIVKLLLSKTKPLNTIAKHNTYQTIINHHFTDRHLHHKNDLTLFETPRLSNCFVINFVKTHIWKGKRIWSLIKNWKLIIWKGRKIFTRKILGSPKYLWIYFQFS